MLFWKGHKKLTAQEARGGGDRSGGDRSGGDCALRRLLQAAAYGPGDPPEPSPFLMTRIKAAAAEAERQVTAHPVGAAAWQMLPALAVVLALLTAWNGYESVQLERAQDEAFARLMLDTDHAGSAEILLAAVLTGDDGGGGR